MKQSTTVKTRSWSRTCPRRWIGWRRPPYCCWRPRTCWGRTLTPPRPGRNSSVVLAVSKLDVSAVNDTLTNTTWDTSIDCSHWLHLHWTCCRIASRYFDFSYRLLCRKSGWGGGGRGIWGDQISSPKGCDKLKGRWVWRWVRIESEVQTMAKLWGRWGRRYFWDDRVWSPKNILSWGVKWVGGGINWDAQRWSQTDHLKFTPLTPPRIETSWRTLTLRRLCCMPEAYRLVWYVDTEAM